MCAYHKASCSPHVHSAAIVRGGGLPIGLLVGRPQQQLGGSVSPGGHIVGQYIPFPCVAGCNTSHISLICSVQGCSYALPCATSRLPYALPCATSGLLYPLPCATAGLPYATSGRPDALP